VRTNFPIIWENIKILGARVVIWSKFHMKDQEILGVTVVRPTWRTVLCTPALGMAVLTHKKALQCSKFLSDAGLGSETAHPKLLQGCSLPRNLENWKYLHKRFHYETRTFFKTCEWNHLKFKYSRRTRSPAESERSVSAAGPTDGKPAAARSQAGLQVQGFRTVYYLFTFSNISNSGILITIFTNVPSHLAVIKAIFPKVLILMVTTLR